jgi:hypothetical protein
MSQSKTTYVFDGEIGNQAKAVLMGCVDLAASATLKTFLNSHSEGEINMTSFSNRVVTDNLPGAGSNTDKRGIAYFQDTDTGGTVRFTVPAVIVTDTEEIPGRDGGIRLTDTFMGLLQEALEAATGKNLRKLYGVVIIKR